MSAPVEPRRRGILPPLPPEAARAVLTPPRLPETALPSVALAREAASLLLPVRLETPTAAGRTLVARALHASAGRTGPLVAAEGRCRALHDLPAGASVLIDLAQVTVPATAVLEALLDDGAAWLLVGTLPGSEIPPALVARLDAVTLRVPPLAERVHEMPALATHMVAMLSARRRGPAPALSPEALAWLAMRPWPGDLQELEMVIARGLLRAGAATITVRHLSREAEGVPAEPFPAPRADGHARVEYLAAEMAHELKNPLVTIKTFADHLPAMLDDAELRTRFAGLASESIARMDDLLENVLAFARQGAPQPSAVEIGPLLDAVVAEVEPELAARGVRLDYAGANGARRSADADQLAYALRNVLGGVVREVPPGDALHVDGRTPGVVRVVFAGRDAAATRLRQLVVADAAFDPHDPTLLPLPFTLARTVLERNGGALEVRADGDGRTMLEVHLPGGGTSGGRNGGG
jgi:signal transduction histidine kinase